MAYSLRHRAQSVHVPVNRAVSHSGRGSLAWDEKVCVFVGLTQPTKPEGGWLGRCRHGAKLGPKEGPKDGRPGVARRWVCFEPEKSLHLKGASPAPHADLVKQVAAFGSTNRKCRLARLLSLAGAQRLHPQESVPAQPAQHSRCAGGLSPQQLVTVVTGGSAGPPPPNAA